MCEAVLYDYLGQLRKSFYTNTNAKLLVLATFERIKLITWGKRELEQNSFPIGGTLYREDIINGKYDFFFPKPVRLSVAKFHIKDNEGKKHWYEVINGLFMQGVLLNNNSELRVYVVTISPITPDASFNFWPRLLYISNFELMNNFK